MKKRSAQVKAYSESRKVPIARHKITGLLDLPFRGPASVKLMVREKNCDECFELIIFLTLRSKTGHALCDTVIEPDYVQHAREALGKKINRRRLTLLAEFISQTTESLELDYNDIYVPGKVHPYVSVVLKLSTGKEFEARVNARMFL